MSPQDKVERVLKEIHVTFSKSEMMDGHPDKVIIDRKKFLGLLDRLNQGIYDMMDQYEQTRQSRNNAERAFRKKGDEIIEKSYFEKSYVQNQILGKALLESMMILDRRCIVSYISQKDLRFFEAVPSDLEGIVSQLRQTAGVETAIFLYETEPHTYKVSLRSKGCVDVSRIAKYFGGGGHVRAAGVTMKGTVHDVINNISGQIALQLCGADSGETEC